MSVDEREFNKFLVRLHGEYNILVKLVDTPRKFIIAELSIRKLGSSSVQNHQCFISAALSSSVLLALMKIRAYGSKALQ